MSEPRIRAKALCVFRHADRILVSEAFDPVKNAGYCRPLGGSIEFGETGAQAIVREIDEELGLAITNVRLLGTLENIFTYLGKPGHEIVLIFDAEFVDQSTYDLPVLPACESDGTVFGAKWVALAEFRGTTARLPVYPDGLLELLDATYAG